MCAVNSAETFGYPAQTWERAKTEAIRAIVLEAKPMPYSDLAKKIMSVSFGAHDRIFHSFLGQISVEEDAAGRGMLSALVVHKDDGKPGKGFFDLAKTLGRDVTDEDRCWNDEVKTVLQHCLNHPLRR
jgi:hypothetical protein